MRKTILVFSLLIFAIFMLFQFSKFSVISGSAEIEIILAVIAMVFFIVGFIIHKKTSTHKPNHESVNIDFERIKALEISDREYQVLQFISEGLSNKEIGEKLFLSESTIKTHVSNLLMKLNAKRRTQALQIAKSYNII